MTAARGALVTALFCVLPALTARAQFDGGRARPAAALPALLAATPPAASPAASPAPTRAAAAGNWALDARLDPDRYRLGPGDRLLLLLDGKSLRRLELAVLPEGILEWEGGLRENVAGLSLREAEAAVRKALAPIMPAVAVRLLLSAPRQIEVQVQGEVAAPGAVRLTASDRLSAAIAAAGGPNARGSRRFVEFRQGGHVTRLDLYPFQRAGDWDANPYCPAGVLVFVPLRRDTVQVIGAVNRPGTYEWREGETLADLLAYAEGLASDALPGSILLERADAETPVARQLDAESGATPLRPGDVIVVASRKPLLTRVFLEGAGERLGEVYLSPGETLGDLVRRLGDMRGSALPEAATLERRGTERSRFLRFDLRAVLRGESPAELPIAHDDVLYVPQRPTEVFVLGEVRKPGPLRYVPSWTVGQYLALAGGVGDKGSEGKLHVVDASGESRRVTRTDNLHRGDVLVVGRSNLSIFSEVLLTAASLSGLILAINALAK